MPDKPCFEIRTAEDIHEAANYFKYSRILLTAFELRIFDILDAKSSSSKEVAKKTKSDPRGMDRLLNALCVMKLLKKKNGMFFNTSVASANLVRSKPGVHQYLGHITNLWKTWGSLTESVKKGGRALPKKMQPQDVEYYISAMHYLSTRNAPAVIKEIDFKNVKNILDIGGGSGAYSIEMVKKNKEATATIFDLEQILPITKKYIRKSGLSDRINTNQGDILKNNPGVGFDLVFISSVIHIYSPNENKQIIEKAYKSLNSGGRIIISDFIVDENRTAPAWAVFFALNMLVNTDTGDTYTFDEVRTWLSKAGFKNIHKKNTKAGAMLIIGDKE